MPLRRCRQHIAKPINPDSCQDWVLFPQCDTGLLNRNPDPARQQNQGGSPARTSASCKRFPSSGRFHLNRSLR